MLVPRTANIFVGLGAQTTGGVVPVTCWEALPSQTYTCFPAATYYISTGNYTPGMAVDVKDFGLTALVDFQKLGTTAAMVTQNLNGTYTVQRYGKPIRQPHVVEDVVPVPVKKVVKKKEEEAHHHECECEGHAHDHHHHNQHHHHGK